MNNSKKLKVYICIFFIFSLISCKSEREPSDCEADYKTLLALSCTDVNNANFCLIDTWSYYKCKERNSKKLYNKVEF